MSAWQAKFAAQYKGYVQSLLQPSGPGGINPLDHEFNELLEVDNEISANPDEFHTGRQPINRSKNRNETVLPNDATRIHIAELGNNDNTYINANYIGAQSLFDLPFNYIATQAPLDSTVGDFWRMIAECSVSFIVMLTNEHNSAVYYPQSQESVLRVWSSFTVRLTKMSQGEDVIIRNMVLTNSENRVSRDITMFQFIGWPDEGVPRNTVGLMNIILALGKLQEALLNPILVHCEDGVGRTGVFIAMHVCLALFSLDKEINVKKVVEMLKYQRTGMVKTKLQYQFLVCALDLEFQRTVSKHQQGPPPAAGFEIMPPPNSQKPSETKKTLTNPSQRLANSLRKIRNFFFRRGKK